MAEFLFAHQQRTFKEAGSKRRRLPPSFFAPCSFDYSCSAWETLMFPPWEGIYTSLVHITDPLSRVSRSRGGNRLKRRRSLTSGRRRQRNARILEQVSTNPRKRVLQRSAACDPAQLQRLTFQPQSRCTTSALPLQNKTTQLHMCMFCVLLRWHINVNHFM